MSNVSDPLYDDLNETSDFWKIISPAMNFEGKYEFALVDRILKNTYDIPRRDGTYEIRVRLFEFSDEGVVAKFDSDDYPFATIPNEEYKIMTDLLRNINKKPLLEKVFVSHFTI